MRADDALRCVEHGADAIVVSNHGGRQLDGAAAAIEALPAIADAVSGRAELYFDSGIRRGTDIVDRKSTRLNSSHANISYAVFCLKKKTIQPISRLSPS